jgi:hypothetical protein
MNDLKSCGNDENDEKVGNDESDGNGCPVAGWSG